MPSTVYKGDLAEVVFGHESGCFLRSATAAGVATTGSPESFQFTSAASGSYSTLTFSGGAANSPVQGGKLQYPEGILVGCPLTIHSGSGNFSADDYATTGQIFTIIGFTNASGASVLTIQPALQTGVATSTGDDNIFIHSLGTPAPHVGMSHNASANLSQEMVLTDQFLGLAATVTLPDIKNEIKRSHVVGIGRDVVVQVGGKQSLEGGDMDFMLNSPRWLYYCLGAEAIKENQATGYAVVSPTLAAAATAGDAYLDLDDLTNIQLDDYIVIEDTTAADLPTDVGPTNTWSQFSSTSYNKTQTNEIRRVVGISDGTLYKTVWLDDPLCFSHDSGLTCRVVRFSAGSTNGPDVDKDTLNITNATERLIYSNWSLPSFAIETSIRTRNIGAHSDETGAGVGVPGSSNDAKTLTRVFKGCKVKDFTITADSDSEVKLKVGFDALQVYTDTGRKESPAGDRYTAHRMFENTGNGVAERKIAGIAPYTQKPYLYYNGEIKAFGQTMARVTKFNLSGKNNTTQHWVVKGADITMNDTTDQVPFAATRMPVYAVEGKMEYDCSMEVIIDDPLLWDELRYARTRDYTAPITLTLIKQGSGAVREKIEILIDDYMVESAPLPIPEDKGVIRTELAIKPKHVSVKSIDALFHC